MKGKKLKSKLKAFTNTRPKSPTEAHPLDEMTGKQSQLFFFDMMVFYSCQMYWWLIGVDHKETYAGWKRDSKYGKAVRNRCGAANAKLLRLP